MQSAHTTARTLRWFTTLLVGLTGIAMVTVVLYLRGQRHEAGQQALAATARMVQEQTERTLQTIDRELAHVDDRLTHLEPKPADQGKGTPLTAQAGQRLLRSHLKDLPFLRAMVVLDAQGSVLADSQDAPGTPLAAQPYLQVFQEQLKPSLYLGSTVRRPGGDGWEFTLARARRDADGHLKGVVLATVRVDYFDRLWRGLDLGETGTVSLLRSDATVLMASPWSDNLAGASWVHLPLFAWIDQGQRSGVFENMSASDGDHQELAYQALSGYPVVALVGKSEQAMLAHWAIRAQWAMLLWGLASIAVLTMGFKLAHSLEQMQVADQHQKSLKAQLSRAEALANFGSWSWRWGPDGVVQGGAWSDNLYRMYGRNPDDGVPTPDAWKETIHPDDLQSAERDIAQALAGPGHYRFSFRILTKDTGTLRYIESVGSVDKDLNGALVHTWGVDQDMTERVQQQATLRESEMRWRFAIEGAGDALWDWDIEHDQAFFSDRWKQMMGYRPDEIEVVGDTWMTMLHPEDRSRVIAEARAHLLGKAPHFNSEHRMLRKDGSEIWILGRALVVARDAQGKALRMIGTNSDITERKKAEVRLQHALAEKVGLLNEVHHRVKNNLQVVTSLLRLEGRRSSQPETQTVLADMQGRIRAMALLHESLYREGTFASVDLAVYLRQLCQQTFRAHAGRGGAVRLVLDLCPAQVSMDVATPCGLLVNELLSNCLKHAFPNERAGEARVSLQAQDPAHWVLTVSDDGVGLPGDFEARRTQSLGLQLVSDLATQLGGKMETASPPTAGSQFKLIFKSRS